MSDAPPQRFDPFSSSFQRDPYPIYDLFRGVDPIHRGRPPMPSMPTCWYLFRYRDVSSVLQDDRFGRDRTGVADRSARVPSASTVIRRVVRRMVLFADPPRHTRMRRALELAWNKEISHRVSARSEELTASLIEELEARSGGDLMTDLCVPLPVLVMAQALGIPDSHRLRIKRWATSIIALTDLHEDEATLVEAARATAEVVEYLRDLLGYRKRYPGPDLLSRLVNMPEGESRLTEDEILANAVLLLAAGHETTVGLLGNGFLALLERPDVVTSLLERPALIPRAVEEMLRFDSPIQMTFRTAHEPVEVDGVRVARGESVALVMGSANRDPAVFPAPQLFNPERTPNAHLGFGGGPHNCYGSSLARREARAALTTLLGILPRMRISGPPVWSKNYLFRSLESLPVRIEG